MSGSALVKASDLFLSAMKGKGETSGGKSTFWTVEKQSFDPVPFP